jgi:hypothetical protein
VRAEGSDVSADLISMKDCTKGIEKEGNRVLQKVVINYYSLFSSRRNISNLLLLWRMDRRSWIISCFFFEALNNGLSTSFLNENKVFISFFSLLYKLSR